jgi:hypothetical protein
MKGLGLATTTLRAIVIAATRMMDADAMMPILLCPARKRNTHNMTEADKLPRRVRTERILPTEGFDRPTFTQRKRLVSHELS